MYTTHYTTHSFEMSCDVLILSTSHSGTVQQFVKSCLVSKTLHGIQLRSIIVQLIGIVRQVVVFHKGFIVLKDTKDAIFHLVQGPDTMIGIVPTIGHPGYIIPWIGALGQSTRGRSFSMIRKEHIVATTWTTTPLEVFFFLSNVPKGLTVHGRYGSIGGINAGNVQHRRSEINAGDHGSGGGIGGNSWTPYDKGNSNIMFVQMTLVHTHTMLTKLKSIVTGTVYKITVRSRSVVSWLSLLSPLYRGMDEQSTDKGLALILQHGLGVRHMIKGSQYYILIVRQEDEDIGGCC